MLFYLVNIGIVLITLLIAYWWANQGLFSAILHLLCVIVAGAIALAFWEPITVNLLLHGNQFDDYAWGISLVVVFVVALLLMRVIADKVAPANVALPHWVNMVFGFAVGLAAAELTMGILIIGGGFVQTQRDFMGINGWQRDNNGRIRQIEDMPIWTMAHQITDEFYSRLSAGALSTRTPLAHYNPELYKQCTLIRDGLTDSRERLVAKTSLVPEAAKVINVFRSTEAGRIQVLLRVGRAAFDGGGQQLALSSSQVRLIGEASGGAKAAVVYPVAWSQRAGETIGYFQFDTSTHYSTSQPGSESTELLIEFPLLPGGARPKFIQIRGTRILLPALDPAADMPTGQFVNNRLTLGGAIGSELATGGCDSTMPTLTRDDIEITQQLPVLTGTNRLPGGITLEDQKVFEGKADFPKGGDRPPRSLIVDKFFEQPGTKIIQVNVSRSSNASLFSPFVRKLGDGVTPFLIDSSGNAYRALGYIHDKGQVVTVYIDRTDGVGSLAQLPELPTSGSESLRLVFQVTAGVDLTCFRVNDKAVANVKLQVPAAGVKPAPPPDDEELPSVRRP